MSDDISIPTARPIACRAIARRHGSRRRRTLADHRRRPRRRAAGRLVGGWAMLGRPAPHRVPVVQADSGPMRVKPANPGGMQVAGADNDDLLRRRRHGTVDKLAPPPETPDLQALRAPPAAATAPKPAEAPQLAAAPPAPPPAMQHQPSRRSRRWPAAAPSRPRPPMTASPRSPPRPPTTIRHRRRPLGPRHVGAACRADVGARGAGRVGAAGQADAGPAGRQAAAVSKIEHDGHTFWRLRTGGFSDTAQATLFCMRVRAKGAACSVADF